MDWEAQDASYMHTLSMTLRRNMNLSVLQCSRCVGVDGHGFYPNGGDIDSTALQQSCAASGRISQLE